MKKKVEIIPLGQNCMPRTILTRWKVKPKKLFGEFTFPFDLAVFETREITKSIKTDFSEFFFNINYREDSKIWAKEPDCIEFVHEKCFRENDKAKLIDKYLKRIENFRSVMKSSEPLLFVQILGDCDDTNNLYQVLSDLRGENPFRFAVIDTQNITKAHNGIDILKIEYPSYDYKKNWWKKEYYTTLEGVNFERKIAEFCRKITDEITA